jgi:site-specific DNA-methyltransferase (cytosine-N4-specific)
MTLRYIVGDTRDVTATIPDGSVDLIFTSPPFLALRSYLPADHVDKHREIGSEATPAAFIDVLLEMTAEWGRVLAPHGTLAVELGDTYSGSGGAGGDYSNVDGFHEGQPTFKRKRDNGWPLPKSLAGIPQAYMLSLIYGYNVLDRHGPDSPAGKWRARNWLAWHRPNPPVGALGDKWRPASSYITVACRGQKRWFDLDAVRTEHKRDPATISLRHGEDEGTERCHNHGNETFANSGNDNGAPPLDWHTDGDLGVGHIVLSTQPYAGSHYATFPMDLPRKIIDCMCPRSVCRVCGVARERMVEHERTVDASATPHGKSSGALHSGGPTTKFEVSRETIGWSDCSCPHPTKTVDGASWVESKYRPGITFDPFVGSGTTLAATQDLGRDGIGIDIDPRNADLARERCGMFLEVAEHTHPAGVTA